MIFHTKTKINIGLAVTEKRADGFHNIESIFYPINFGDVLEVVPTWGYQKISFESYGIKIPGDPMTNLCVKAYECLAQEHDLPSVKVALLKNVPIGAGLGGGSSDGVEMLKALNILFDLQLNTESLLSYALVLGSDCPFFIANTPKLVTGRGEIMQATKLSLNKKWVVLVFPSFHVSTPLAYSLITPQSPKFDLASIHDLPIEKWQGQIVNDFELPIANIHPEVQEIKMQLEDIGAVYTSMSGSGSTVYGIFNSPPNTKVLNYPSWTGKL